MDYYDVLGVSRSASDKDIKTAFRKLAAKHHPDKGGDSRKFQEINEAYQTLSNPEKRQMYDQFGTADPQQAGYQQQGFHFNGAEGFEEMFSQFFGGGDPFGMGNNRRRNRSINKTLNLNVQISEEEAYNGKLLNIDVPLPSGRRRAVDTRIPAGVDHCQTIRLTGMGDDSLRQYPAGDLHLTIHINRSNMFNRQGADLYLNKTVSVFDLMLGTEIIIDHYNDRKVKLKVPAGTQPNTVFSMKGLGMPFINRPEIGQLYVTVKGELPKNLTPEQINLITQLKGLSN